MQKPQRDPNAFPVPFIAERSIERYHLATDQWQSAGTLPPSSTNPFGAFPLTKGKVLLLTYRETTAEPLLLYDPSTQTVAAAPAFASVSVQPFVTQLRPLAVQLLDGRVLASDGKNVDIYDPATDRWTATVPMQATHAAGTAVVLGSGSVLVVGDFDNNGTTDTSSVTEVFDIGSGRWTTAGQLPNSLADTRAALLPAGKVVLAGGFIRPGSLADPTDYVPNASLFDPTTQSWSRTASRSVVGQDFTLTLMPTDGLDAGGLLQKRKHEIGGGASEIRTHGGVAPSLVFKTSALNRSAIAPARDCTSAERQAQCRACRARPPVARRSRRCPWQVRVAKLYMAIG